jgi:hypothetical protein
MKKGHPSGWPFSAQFEELISTAQQVAKSIHYQNKDENECNDQNLANIANLRFASCCAGVVGVVGSQEVNRDSPRPSRGCCRIASELVVVIGRLHSNGHSAVECISRWVGDHEEAL